MRQSVSLWDRFVSVATYFTFGMAGLIWLIASFLIFKKTVTQFCAYHIYQSIFIAVILAVLGMFFDIAYSFTSQIPYIGSFIQYAYVYLVRTPIYFTFSLIHFVIFLFLVYLSFGAVLGKYSYLPFISDVIKSNFRN